MKQLRFNVRDALARTIARGRKSTSGKPDYEQGFYDGYMARSVDQQRLRDNQRAAKKR